MVELVDRLRTEEGRRVARLGNRLSMRYAHREDVRALLREAADALEAAREESDRWRDRYRSAIDEARGKGGRGNG